MTDTNTVAVEGDAKIELSISDISNAVAVIDYACDQGAFKGWGTIEQVLTVRSRLKSFVDAATAASESPDETETETDETSSAAE